MNKKYDIVNTEENELNLSVKEKSILNENLYKRDNILYSDFKLRDVSVKIPKVIKTSIFNRAETYQDYPQLQNIRVLRERMSVVNDFYKKKYQRSTMKGSDPEQHVVLII
jgi:hypothetical protein